MDFRPVPRDPEAFQQSVTAEDIHAIALRAFGRSVRIASAVELGGGMYNNTYRLLADGLDGPVILRIAPAPQRQFASEHELMRNEYATVPFLAPIADLVPRVLAADWSQEITGRDWMVQSHLDGTPAPDRLGDYPRTLWQGFFAQLGTITKNIHAVAGPRFGPVAGPGYATWSEAVLASLTAIADDVSRVGLDAADVRKAADLAAEHHKVLDEITEPRLLTGDLWTVNTMLAAAPTPVISGVLDLDRTLWGDPAADWTIRMASAKTDERTAFWDTYGPRAATSAHAWRALVYEARHLGAIRLERHRLHNPSGVDDTYTSMAAVLAQLI
ncbi:aminoglycoside phosphotransferase family protein [Streptomyces sp. NBC_00365]|uniref:phosphotransferase family protein n=1 Tax=Streptomyces sp. NBC_00365 TaxID=2975726 RepID=UPI00225A6C46|nr:aminoglycoside phosphotransferase family protein [Streptomyces sp. NBC_00365]MCX5097798.1 aminoglycoside phosphotransferase family protein [Streptomyces sp. NBC_00365]